MRVLAARQWTVDPAAPVLSLELLATFVQPNHPAVGRLVGRAAQLLEERTRSGSLAVTEATAERRDAVVEAVCDAVVEAGVHYAEPPASWGYGQKVRTPGDVLDDRIGTCLDTTVLVASALEHIGITPVLWVPAATRSSAGGAPPCSVCPTRPRSRSRPRPTPSTCAGWASSRRLC